MPNPLFIGLDLAWSAQHNTAAAVISYDTTQNGGAGLLSHWAARLSDNAEILDFVRGVAGPDPKYASPSLDQALAPALIAIDAPLVVPNVNGARLSDRIVSQVFRRFQAGTHPANRINLGRYGNPPGDIRGETLATQLQTQLGFAHSPYVWPSQLSRQFFECYPHPAMVVLFDLQMTLKYKRKLRSVANDRFAAYDALQQHLRNLADISVTPRLLIPPDLLNRDTREIVGGVALKQYEDLLDSIVCAYTAFYYWWWGTERNFVFGDLANGYIVTPITPVLRQEAVNYWQALHNRDTE